MMNHDDDHDDHHDDDAPLAPLPATPEHGYWKSMRELAGTASWQTEPSLNEFPPIVEKPIDPLSRRNFFHLMGASMALAGVAGCQRYEKEEIVPLGRRPEDQTPSTTMEYATAWELGGSGHALVATSYEGRPIHLDGNADHPFIAGGIVPGTKRHGGASHFAQANILHLYDPDRSQSPTSGGKGTTMESFRNALDALKKAVAAGARVLSEPTSSPTIAALRHKLIETYPATVWHEYEPLSWDGERAGTAMAFGRPVRPLAHLDRAETIVTIDCDIFVEHPAALMYSRDFAKSRRVDGSLGIGKMCRLWAAESTMTNTGAMADHRLPVRSEHCAAIVAALASALGVGPTPAAEVLKESSPAKWIEVLAAELKANTGKAVVLAGRRQPAEVHALVAHINAKIGAPGATLSYVEDPGEPDRPTHLESIKSLVRDMQQSKVSTLIILGGNPVYDAPADLDFAGALGKVATSLHLSEYEDETSKKCSWHVPRAHALEAWGLVRTWDGTITTAQPLIAPLYGGLTPAELLALLLDVEMTGEQLAQGTLAKLGHIKTGETANASFDKLGLATPDLLDLRWRQYVMDGFIPNTQLPDAPVTLKDAPPPLQLTDSQRAGSKRANGDLEVAFHFSSFTYDGRFANNPWLWETPDFLTKVTWDNYALVGPETAQVLGLENDTMITIKIGDRTVDVPCYTMPGQAKYSIGLVLGGGRTAAGHVGGREGKVPQGYDTNKVRMSTGFDIASKCSATATGKKYELADVQDHWDYRPGIKKDVGKEAIEKRAPELIRTVQHKQFLDHRDWKAEEEAEFFDDTNDDGKGGRPRGMSLFEEHEYKDRHRWGMAIDLTTCTGCNACMVACQSENNIPVVGRREVIHNREMSWIRIDRYFKGSPEEPEVYYQPLACQQCENAPCEQVCPVGATSHSDEGLNDMAYNRCIGTRYCANNCPYKVRRFNFLDWNKEFRDARMKVRRLLFNPEVTVRMRGVMEKCTFCVQRIQNAKIKWKAEIRGGQRVQEQLSPSAKKNDAPWDLMPDGHVVTACQAACPTEAIIFGDLADPESRIYHAHYEDRRQYALLPEMYTKPRNRYLARVRNPNPAMPNASAAKPEGGAQ